jgi:beta-lactamase superfamily II metal-dependent hydrolase
MIVLLVALGLAAVPAAQSGPARTLDIYYVDTEGGQSTLFRSPTGETLLVDTGNAGQRDLDRILEVLKVAGVTRLDHLLTTHYHGDHYGSLLELVKQIPVARFYDHGENIEKRDAFTAFKTAYEEVSREKRTVVRPGDRIQMAGLDIRVVASNGDVVKSNLPGGGIPNPACREFKPRQEVVDDNHQSAGFVMAYGRFRTIDLGDLMWSKEFDLMCPTNRIGTVDLYLTSHHGLALSGGPVLVHALAPRVAVMNNGPRKGGAVEALQVLATSPGLEDLWQLHWSQFGGIEHNAPGSFIANLDDLETTVGVLTALAAPPASASPAAGLPAAGAPAAGARRGAAGGRGGAAAAAHTPAHWIKVSAQQDGSFTVTNSRNGFTKSYAARK